MDNPTLFAIYIVYKASDLYPDIPPLPLHGYASLRQAMRHIRHDVQPKLTEIIPDTLWRAEGYTIQRLAVINTWQDNIEVVAVPLDSDE